jgi:hypothetical protein
LGLGPVDIPKRKRVSKNNNSEKETGHTSDFDVVRDRESRLPIVEVLRVDEAMGKLLEDETQTHRTAAKVKSRTAHDEDKSRDSAHGGRHRAEQSHPRGRQLAERAGEVALSDVDRIRDRIIVEMQGGLATEVRAPS